MTGRQALRTALITLALLFGLAAFLFLNGDRSARNDLSRLIDTDIAGLNALYLSKGVGALTERIDDRLTIESPEHPQSGYLLLDPQGRRLAGNISPRGVIHDGGSGLQRVSMGQETVALGRVTVLEGGFRLVVARSVAHIVRMVARFGYAFLVGGLLMVALAGLGAWLSARRLQTRLDAFDAAFTRAEAGDLHARVAEDRGVDELSVLTRDVNHLLAQFERLLASQRKITDQTAHEIRTPLMHLDSVLVRAIAACKPEDAELLNQGRSELRLVAKLLDALLDIARLEAKQGDPRGLAPFDLAELASEMAELYAASFDEAGLALETRIAPGVTLVGDATMSGRLIANLLDNAIKYVPSPGRVRLVVEAGPRITVEDDGPGVAADKRDWIFSRYARAGDEAPGHGLGLALVRAIAERQGLTARVEDAAPGARFVVEASVGRTSAKGV